MLWRVTLAIIVFSSLTASFFMAANTSPSVILVREPPAFLVRSWSSQHSSSWMSAFQPSRSCIVTPSRLEVMPVLGRASRWNTWPFDSCCLCWSIRCPMAGWVGCDECSCNYCFHIGGLILTAFYWAFNQGHCWTAWWCSLFGYSSWSSVLTASCFRDSREIVPLDLVSCTNHK